MSDQEKIQYLRRYRDNEREITRLQEEILKWDSLSRKVTVSFGDTGGSSGDDQLQAAVEKIIELQGKLAGQIMDRVRLRGDIERTIGTVADERLRQLLRHRYIDGMRLEEIAVLTHLDYRWVRRLLGRGIEKLTLESPLSSVI